MTSFEDPNPYLSPEITTELLANYWTMNSMTTTTEMSKPKKRIFSSGTKQNRAVFNMKNFWSADNNSKKIVSSKKKSTIFDVQYVWRPKTSVTTTSSHNQKKGSTPEALITTTTETSLTYLAPKTTQSSVISPVKTSTTSQMNNSMNSTNNSLKNTVKQMSNCVSTHSMSTRRTPSTTPSVINLSDDLNDSTIIADESQPNSPPDSVSEISENSSNPPSEESSHSLPTASALLPSVEPLTRAPDTISSESSSASTTSSTTTTTTSMTTIGMTSKPKRKIFSSARKEDKKNRAVFNAKNFWTSDPLDFGEDFGQQSVEQTVNKSDNKNKLSDDFDAEEEDYVVLRKVKKAHQVHDLGETEQFDDDIKYHLSGIDGSNSSAMRCLRFVSFPFNSRLFSHVLYSSVVY